VIEQVVLAFDPGGQRGGIAARDVEVESGLHLRAEMAGMVGGGDDLDVGRPCPASLVKFVLDACIGNLNLSFDERELVLLGYRLLNGVDLSLGIGLALELLKS